MVVAPIVLLEIPVTAVTVLWSSNPNSNVVSLPDFGMKAWLILLHSPAH